MTLSTQMDIHQAQALVEALQENNQVKAGEILDELTQMREFEIYQHVSELTANLHQTLDHLDDNTLLLQTKHDIPDATERLEYVIQTTEEASGKTLDTAEQALQSLEILQQLIQSEFDVDKLQRELNQIHKSLTEIMLAQSFQDLTGQVLNRVIFVITSLEQSLIQLIDNSRHDYHAIPEREDDVKGQKSDEMKGVGPNVTQKSKQDIVETQEDIDDLLSNLGI